MKNLLLLVLLCTFFGVAHTSAQEPLTSIMETREDFVNASKSFAHGDAKTGQQYYSGLLAEVILVDMTYQLIDQHDLMNSPANEITATIDSCIALIDHARLAIKVYKNKKWPKRAEFHELTLVWLDAVEKLVNQHARPLISSMVKADEDLTDEEIDLYIAWENDYNKFLDTDQEWVDFQQVYAKANDFEIADETIDTDELLNE